MNTVIKVILGILVVVVLLYIGGVVLNLLGTVLSFALRLIIGALVVVLVIWLIDRAMRGSRV
jgi:hypothetical protein